MSCTPIAIAALPDLAAIQKLLSIGVGRCRPGRKGLSNARWYLHRMLIWPSGTRDGANMVGEDVCNLGRLPKAGFVLVSNQFEYIRREFGDIAAGVKPCCVQKSMHSSFTVLYCAHSSHFPLRHRESDVVCASAVLARAALPERRSYAGGHGSPQFGLASWVKCELDRKHRNRNRISSQYWMTPCTRLATRKHVR